MINNSVVNIISHSNIGKVEKYNILTFPTHERYETQLCKTGHNFYSFTTNNSKTWNKNQCELPENYYCLPNSNLCTHINYDFILCQSKFGQFQLAQKIQDIINVPIICLEHTIPLVGFQHPEQIQAMSNMIGNVNVFISEYSQVSWKIPVDSHVIHHGIDSETFKPLELDREDHVLTVANDFINRDYCLNYSGWKRVVDGLKTKLVGDTEGLSSAAQSTQELVEEYNKCAVYFNSTTLSPIPTSLLEAMSCGCPVVSTSTCMIPEIIENGVNGFISNDEQELTSYLNMLLNDKDQREKMGKAARQTILDKFSESNFISKWNKIFDETYEVFNT